MKRKSRSRFAVFLSLMIAFCVAGVACSGSDTSVSTPDSDPPSDPGGPTFVDWGTGTPESQGMSTAALDAMWSDLEAKGTAGFLVIRNDNVIYERYVSLSRSGKHSTASLAKSLVGSMALMIAMQDGLISSVDPVYRYVSQWETAVVKKTITIRQLATHTSGLADAATDAAFWDRLPVPNDPFTISRDDTSVIYTPGSAVSYSNPGFAMLAYAITASLQGASNPDIRSLLENRVMSRIGIPDSEWDCGYGETFTVDGLPLVAVWGGANFSPNAAARVGRLVLRYGFWNGDAIIGSAIVQEATSHPSGLPGNASLGWWANSYGNGLKRFSSLPSDAFWGAGAGHEVLLIVPSMNLIMVRFGESLGDNFDPAMNEYLFTPLMAAVTG